MPIRRAVIIVTSAFVLSTALFLLIPQKTLIFDYDQNAYLGGAAALKAGHGYRFEQYIDLPRIGTYPPGYSAWLAAFWENGEPFPINSNRLEFASWIAAACALFALASFLVASEMSALAASAVLLAIGTSVVFTQSMVLLRADILFTALSCLLALLIAKYEPGRSVLIWWLAAGLLAALLYLVKTAALAYIVALGVFGLLGGDFRRPSRLLCFTVPILPVVALWSVFTQGLPTYGSFFVLRVAELGGLPGYLLNAARQAVFYASGRWIVEAMLSFPDGASTSTAPWLARISFPAEVFAFSIGLGLFAIPIFLGIRKGCSQPGDRITLLVLGSSAALFIFWPWYLGARCGIALIPFLLNWLWRGLTYKALRVAFLTVLLVNIPLNARLSYRITRNYEQESTKNLKALRQAASWINSNARTGANVAAGRDVPITQLFEYLGRRLLAVPVGNKEYADVLPGQQSNQRADYVIIDSNEWPVKSGYRVERVYGRWAITSPAQSTMTVRP